MKQSADYNRNQKENQEEEEKVEKKKEDAERKRKQREKKTDDEKLNKQKKDAERKKKQRENTSEGEKLKKKKEDAERKREQREKKTEEEKLKKNEEDAERKRKQKEKKTEEEKQKIKEDDTQRKKKHREKKTEEEKVKKNEEDAERKKKQREEKKKNKGENEGKGVEVDVIDFQEATVTDMFDVSSGSFKEGKKCEVCQALLFRNENSSFCCSNGKITLKEDQKLKSPPTELKVLLKSKGFIQDIRRYNNIMAMASLGTSHKPEFGPNFKIQGKLSHRIGSLLPDSGENPKFAQIYFHDTDHETQNRLHQCSDLDSEVIQTLQKMLHQVNPYIHSFKSAIDLGNIGEYKLCLISERNKIPKDGHTRTYNLPDGCEVAAIMPGDIGNLDVIITTR
jgi:hypothetical protein